MFYAKIFKNLLQDSKVGAMMKSFKRGMVYISRNLLKYGLLFGMIFILGCLATGAILVTNAFDETEMNLRSSLPAIASVRVSADYQTALWNEDMEMEFVTLAHLREIENLEYVKTLDYSVINYRFQLNEHLEQVTYMPDVPIGLEDEFNAWLFEQEMFDPSHLSEKYVNRAAFADLNIGLINLVFGRNFTEEELNVANTPYPVLVSTEFMGVNNLNLNDIIVLEEVFHDMEQAGDVIFFGEEIYRGRYEFEIIGVFEVAHDIQAGSWDQNAMSMSALLNRMYFTSATFESINATSFQMSQELYADIWEETWKISDFEQMWSHAVFLLHDPLMLNDFAAAAEDILPTGWEIYYLSNVYGSMSHAMDNMNDLSQMILIGTICTSIIIGSLLILFVLQDRKKEIGIYLALGERKTRIMGQMTLEILIVGSISLLLSLGSGVFISSQFSERIILDQVIRQQEQVVESPIFFPDDPLHWFSPGVMTPHEMVQHFEISMAPSVMVVFLATGLVILCLFSLVPILMVMRKSPKDILTY